jgi:hypothetical protein
LSEVFLYWRARSGEAMAAHEALRAWQEDLQVAVPGLRARRWRREEPECDRCTFMEAYAGGDGASALNAALVERIVSEGNSRLARWLLGPRHVEHFEPLD